MATSGTGICRCISAFFARSSPTWAGVDGATGDSDVTNGLVPGRIWTNALCFPNRKLACYTNSAVWSHAMSRYHGWVLEGHCHEDIVVGACDHTALWCSGQESYPESRRVWVWVPQCAFLRSQQSILQHRVAQPLYWSPPIYSWYSLYFTLVCHIQ